MNIRKLPNFVTVMSVFSLVTIILVGCSAKDEITAPAPAPPFVELYFDKAAWESRVEAYAGSEDAILVFPTTGDNISLSTEIPFVPSSNGNLGPVITFDSTATGYYFSFHLACLIAGYQMTFDDREGADLHQVTPVGYRDRTISIGDTDDLEDDDFEVAITACNENYKVFAIGLEVIDNAVEDGEYIAVQCADTTQDTVFAESPDCGGTGIFMGIVSNQDLLKLIFNENPGGDDIFVRDLHFGVKRK